MQDVIKVKPWAADQGDYVLINAEDFDGEKHVLFDVPQEVERKKPGRPAKAEE
jgi:hypothetical protein